MTLYLLKSSLCLLILLGLYKFLLQKEKIHVFKRFYLLIGLAFSLLVPLFSLPLSGEVTPFSDWNTARIVEAPVLSLANLTDKGADINPSAPSCFWFLYGLVTSLFLGRFLRNMGVLARKIHYAPKRRYEQATLILSNDQDVPYTFLTCIFVDQTSFDHPSSAPELITHELAHVRQHHSVDVLIIELLLVFLWFNPVLYGFRNAIKLNHEFLADDAVNARYPCIAAYQQLLLSKLTHTPFIPFTSSLTFQTTKQRFVMMTQKTSRSKAILIQFAVLALAPALTFVFSTTEAQTPPAKVHLISEQPIQPTPAQEERYKDVRVYGFWDNGKPERNRPKKYSELTPDEKKRVQIIPPDPKKTPTEAQFNEWKNPDRFGIWLDGKRIKNSLLNNYSPSDIVSFWGSYVHKNARRFGKHHYQFELMTAAYYKKYLEEQEKSPLMLMQRPMAKK